MSMSLEENKAIVRRFIEAYNKHNLDSLDEFMAPDYFDHTHQVGPEDLKQLFNMGFKAFPIGMKLLKISLLKEIRCGFVLLIRGPIQANFVD